MMKKILTIFIALLMIAGLAYAGAPPAPAYENAISVSGNGEPGSPPQEYILVRYVAQGPLAASVTSGDVLTWSFISADGFSVSRDILGYGFAGVAVTAILTPDSSTVSLVEDNWGYMAIRGYCLAKVDTTSATTGFGLVPNGNTLIGSFGTKNFFDAGNAGGPGINSGDVGVLLIDNAADGVMPVWLR